MVNVGLVLANLREKMQISQKEIANGILSIPMMCKVEKGESEVDYIILEALFERLGKSADKIEKAISSEDYDLIYLQNEIKKTLIYSNGKQAKCLLKDYEKKMDKRKGIHIQYVAMINALSSYLEDRNTRECIEKLQEALEITCKTWEKNERTFLCNQEMRICLLISYMRFKEGDFVNADQELRSLSDYIQIRITDEEELVKIYPHVQLLLAKVCMKQNKVEEAFTMIQKGKQCLIDNGSLFPMDAVLELEEKCAGFLRKESLVLEDKKYREAIQFIYSMAEEAEPKEEISQILLYSSQTEYMILNYLVKEMREVKGITQEKLCEGICEQETLSRIESGRRKPHKKILFELMQKLDIEPANYYGFIVSEEYSQYEMVRTYKKLFHQDKEKAKKILGIIKQELDWSEVVNRQFIEMEELRLNNHVNGTEKINQLFQILSYTMPEIRGKNRIYRTPFREEYEILNAIAIEYRKMGKIKTALEIYKNIEDKYNHSKISIKLHTMPALTFYMNYAGFLEADNELDKSEIVSRDGLKFIVTNGRADIAGDILVNRSCIYDKEEKTQSEELHLRNGHAMMQLYQLQKITKFIEEIYYKKYNRFLD